MSEAIVEGAACRPNFSAAGRKRRKNVAIISGVVAVVGLVAAIALNVPPLLRLLVALPAMFSVICGLQVTRNTCVAHARTGSIEGEDFSLTKADAEFAAASKRVAATIMRDGVIAGIVFGVVAVGTGWL